LPPQQAKILRAIFAKILVKKAKFLGKIPKFQEIFLNFQLFSIFFAQNLKLILVTPVIITNMWKSSKIKILSNLNIQYLYRVPNNTELLPFSM
jgi:hypothetical protein